MTTFVSMATCHTCNTTSRYSGGANRDYGVSPFSRNQSTPGGGAPRHRQKTPQTGGGGRVTSTTTSSSSSTPKSLRKDKTPTRTPRASTSSSSSTPASAPSSSSSSSSKVKRWVVQRLSKILVREDEPGRKKSSLKDFLCSL